MNKRKTAIFVEGQTEYIFVRDFLCTWYEYDVTKLGLECYEFRARNTNTLPYPVGSHDSEDFYLIYKVGNDQSVMSKMLKEAGRLKNTGYQLIIGVCDMYCDEYHKAVKDRTINPDVNNLFIKGRHRIIEDSGFQDILQFHFAIMEAEAWLLGMYQFLPKIAPTLTQEFISQKLDIDITADPEVTYYHPAKVLDDIYNLAGKHYGKHQSDICSITSTLSKQDYAGLINSGKCQSFAKFVNAICNIH